MHYPILLFDVDNTIFDFDAGEHCAIEEILAYFDIPFEEIYYTRFHEINEGYWKNLEKGLYTREQLGPLRFQDFANEFHWSFDPQEADARFYDCLSRQVRWLPHAKETIALLSESYDIYLATNGKTSTQLNRAKISGLNQYIKGIFVSEMLGVAKPSKGFYDKVMEALQDNNPRHYVMIGDSLTSDMRGGVNSGITTIWFNPAHLDNTTTPVDYEISQLNQLPDLLNQIK